MSRADRWWRPAPANRRPGVRSRAALRRHVDRAVDDAYDVGYRAGVAEQEKHDQRLRDNLSRVARAAEAAQNGDHSLMDELAREQGAEPTGGDDLLDVAEAAGVTPLPEVDVDQLVDDLERWLREQD
ncbi:hypothetical protein ACFWRG_09745 [Micromonospora tulbaghiae]|uniref:hypothetical protein n=1 Tax=Micromonospora tulbaghiae TaxID=479978 RepID=UPI003663C6A8